VVDPQLHGDDHCGTGGREADEVIAARGRGERKSERDGGELRRQLESVQAAVKAPHRERRAAV
jgi:hypothetical protein